MSPLSPRIMSASCAWPGRDEVAVVVALEADAGAAEDRVAAVRPLVRRREAEQVAEPPIRSSWPRPPKIVSLPPLPSIQSWPSAADARAVLDRLARVRARRSSSRRCRRSSSRRPGSCRCRAGRRSRRPRAPPAMLSSPNVPGDRVVDVVEELDVALLVAVRVDVVAGEVVAVVRVELPRGHVVDVAVVDDQVVAVRVEDRLRLEDAEARADATSRCAAGCRCRPRSSRCRRRRRSCRRCRSRPTP